MKKLVSFFAGFVMLASFTQAQQVSGVVKDQQGKGIEKTTVSLLRAKDSSVVKLVVTADNGKFSVNAPQSGRYMVSASHVGYMATYSQAFELSGSGSFDVADLTMGKATGNLTGVTVTAQKPIIEVKAAPMHHNQQN